MNLISIFETSMSKSVLHSFLSSSAAVGIRAGFEAELCYSQTNPLVGQSHSYNEDFSINPKPNSIDHIIRFFKSHGASQQNISKIKSTFISRYNDYANKYNSRYWKDIEEEEVERYINAHVYNKDEEIIKVLSRFGLSKSAIVKQIKTQGSDWRDAYDEVTDKYQELVQTAIDDRDENYDNAKELALANMTKPSEIDYLESLGLESMLDVAEEYSVDWPIRTINPLTIDSPFSIEVAEALGDTLVTAIKANVELGTGYQTVDRNDTDWIIEPDSSVKPNTAGDFGAEIVSPPMHLDVFFKKLDKFVDWAISNEAYANTTTGFHIGVSLPESAGKIDYIKLVMFLGDMHMLSKFGRQANEYCKPAATGIYNHLRGTHELPSDTDILDHKLESMFTLIKNGFSEIASSMITDKNDDKYTSINLKSDYIEFRIIGGVDYIKRIDEIKDAVARYAYAMTIASDPEMFKKEYASKLYKFLNKSRNDSPSSMDIIANFVSGKIDRKDLKQLYTRSKAKSRSTGSRIPGPKPLSSTI